MAAVLLETRNLHRHFGGVQAVKDVSFRVEEGTGEVTIVLTLR